MSKILAALYKQIIKVELSTGVSLPFRGMRSAKSGNMYHAILKPKLDGSYYDPGKYGVKVAASVVGGSLPKTVKLNGATLAGVPGHTVSGNRKVTFNGDVTVDGEPRVLKLTISALPSGDFNVSGAIHRTRGAAPSLTSL
jgi:hypothetical protein